MATSVKPPRSCHDGDGLVNDADRKLLPASRVVANAHALGLLVHPFTFRNEQRRLASDYKGNPLNEYLAFTYFTDTAVAARALYVLKNDPEAAKCLVAGGHSPACRGLRWMSGL